MDIREIESVFVSIVTHPMSHWQPLSEKKLKYSFHFENISDYSVYQKISKIHLFSLHQSLGEKTIAGGFIVFFQQFGSSKIWFC